MRHRNSLLLAALFACQKGKTPQPTEPDECVALLAEVMRADPFNTLAIGCPIYRNPSDQRPQCAPSGLTPAGSTCTTVELGIPASTTLDTEQWLPAAMFSEPDAYAMCNDIFDADFLATMRRISPLTDQKIAARWDWVDPKPLNEIQRGMLSVLAQINLNNCAGIRYGRSFSHRIHGEFDPKTWTATVYASACSAETIYEDSGVGTMNHAYRFVLVQGHEIGHAIDALTGDLSSDDPKLCEKREARATVYGSYIARCMSRILRDVIESSEYSDVIAASLPDPSPAYFKKVHECIGKKWGEYEKELESISRRAGKHISADAYTAKLSALSNTIACEGL